MTSIDYLDRSVLSKRYMKQRKKERNKERKESRK